MIYIDSPRRLRPGDFTAPLVGWYAGDTPCTAVRVRAGGAEFPCRLEDRPDVRLAYPDLACSGFRCTLDFLRKDTVIQNGFLDLDVLVDDTQPVPVRIDAEPGWAADIASLRGPNLQPATAEELGLGLESGARHYRAYVGIPEHYDLTAASTFSLLTLLGLRQHHRLVDIGCGSLRTGRLLIPYLNAGNYLGVEPNAWLVEEGIRRELGADIASAKRPRFLFNASPAALETVPPSHFALANSIFSHASLPQIREWLEALARHLTGYGALIATYVAGDRDHPGQEWVYPACVRYRTETMQALAESSGFHFAPLDWRHLHGQTWALFARPEFDLICIEKSAPLSWNQKVDAGRF